MRPEWRDRRPPHDFVRHSGRGIQCPPQGGVVTLRTIDDDVIGCARGVGEGPEGRGVHACDAGYVGEVNELEEVAELLPVGIDPDVLVLVGEVLVGLGEPGVRWMGRWLRRTGCACLAAGTPLSRNGLWSPPLPNLSNRYTTLTFIPVASLLPHFPHEPPQLPRR